MCNIVIESFPSRSITEMAFEKIKSIRVQVEELGVDPAQVGIDGASGFLLEDGVDSDSFCGLIFCASNL